MKKNEFWFWQLSAFKIVLPDKRMKNITVSIISKNEAGDIGECIRSAQLISNDVIVLDNGSVDNTINYAQNAGARVFFVNWSGFGNTKNLASVHAKNDWILSLDSDERITKELADSISQLNPETDNCVYGFKRQNFLNNRKIVFGEWGRDKVYRLYNRRKAKWNEALVHEKLDGKGLEFFLLKGNVVHYPIKSEYELNKKVFFYARLSALKFYKQNKKATVIKRFLSPAFNFLKDYILLLGFLNGKEGYKIANYIWKYTNLKYKILKQMH